MITDINAIAQKYGAQEVTLPGWSAEDEFVCKLKRPSLMDMAASGSIPNPLLGTVRTLFSANRKEIENVPLDKQAEAMMAMARHAMVEPTLEELKQVGVTLTDVQLMMIYAYAIGGAAALEPFRDFMRGRAGEPVGDVPSAAQPTDED